MKSEIKYNIWQSILIRCKSINAYVWIILLLSAILYIMPYYFTMPGNSFALSHEDDAQYYSKISQFLIHGTLFTFDGINKTNGFHPLWAMCIAPFHLITQDPEQFNYYVGIFSWIVFVIGVTLVFLCIREMDKHQGELIAALCAGFVGVEFYFSRVTITGLETPLLVTLSLLFLWAGLSGFLEKAQNRSPFILGMALSLVFLARLDTGFFIVCGFSVLLLWKNLREKCFKSAIRFSLGCATLPLLYVFLSSWIVGAVLPVSGVLKTHTSQRICSTSSLANCLTHFINIPGLFTFEPSGWRVWIYSIVKKPLDQITQILGATEGLYGIEPSLAWFGFGLVTIIYGSYISVRCFRWRQDRSELGYLDAFVLCSFTSIVINKVLYGGGAIPYYYATLWSYSIVLILGYLCLNIEYSKHKTLLSYALILVFAIVWVNSIIYHRFYANWLKGDRYYRSLYESAIWVRDHTPPDAVIASYNAGIIGFYSQRKVINLDGKVNSPDYLVNVILKEDGSQFSERLATYFKKNNISFFADFSYKCQHVENFDWQDKKKLHIEEIFSSKLYGLYCGQVFKVEFKD
jgi:hypothetical protein